MLKEGPRDTVKNPFAVYRNDRLFSSHKTHRAASALMHRSRIRDPLNVYYLMDENNTPILDRPYPWSVKPMVESETIEKLNVQARIVHILARLANLAFTNTKEFNSLLDRLDKRITYYEEHL